MKPFTSALIVQIFVAGCMTAPGPIPPKWSGKLYIGDSKAQAVVRKQAGEAILCNEGRFNQIICMSDIDFRALLSTLMIGRAECIPDDR